MYLNVFDSLNVFEGSAEIRVHMVARRPSPEPAPGLTGELPRGRRGSPTEGSARVGRGRRGGFSVSHAASGGKQGKHEVPFVFDGACSSTLAGSVNLDP